MLVKHEQTNDSNIELPQPCPQPLPVFPKREVPPTVGLIDAVLKPHRRLGCRAAADHRITPELTAFVSDGRRVVAWSTQLAIPLVVKQRHAVSAQGQHALQGIAPRLITLAAAYRGYLRKAGKLRPLAQLQLLGT